MYLAADTDCEREHGTCKDDLAKINRASETEAEEEVSICITIPTF